MKRTGRPWKYKPLVDRLDDSELYTVSRIVSEAQEAGLFAVDFDDGKPLTPDQQRAAKKRARSALANMTKKLGEPNGEVEVQKPYRAFYPAWHGSTWKRDR